MPVSELRDHSESMSMMNLIMVFINGFHMILKVNANTYLLYVIIKSSIINLFLPCCRSPTPEEMMIRHKSSFANRHPLINNNNPRFRNEMEEIRMHKAI